MVPPAPILKPCSGLWFQSFRFQPWDDLMATLPSGGRCRRGGGVPTPARSPHCEWPAHRAEVTSQSGTTGLWPQTGAFAHAIMGPSPRRLLRINKPHQLREVECQRQSLETRPTENRVCGDPALVLVLPQTSCGPWGDAASVALSVPWGDVHLPKR